jgi:prevent-host-death family protein
MIATLKDSKAKLSSLVERASRGEEIVITVRGQPKARLMPVVEKPGVKFDRVKWMRRLQAMSEKATRRIRDSADIFDDMRSDRV